MSKKNGGVSLRGTNAHRLEETTTKGTGEIEDIRKVAEKMLTIQKISTQGVPISSVKTKNMRQAQKTCETGIKVLDKRVQEKMEALGLISTMSKSLRRLAGERP
jgi:hypothetical protein